MGCLGTLVASAMFGLPAAASAHPMPRSLVFLDFSRDGVAIELRLPMDRLEIGFGESLVVDARDGLTPEHARRLTTYIREHIGAKSPDGQPWTIIVNDVRSMAWGLSGDTLAVAHGAVAPRDELIAHLWLVPPPSASPRRLTLQYDVIQHRLVTHEALASIRSDWQSGLVAGPPEILGTFGYDATELVIDRPAGSAWRGFASVLRLGMHHIAEGTDHLLFLLVLLLPAVLRVRAGRWAEFAGVGRSVRHLVAIVTAFTIGHSITLAVGGLGLFRAPPTLVESLVAASILVSAVHAIRPLVAGREAIIAGAFGLVHGLAFAATIAEFGLDRRQTALSILGFNLGIEVMQLVVVAVTVPWLVVLATTRFYTPVRIGGALAAGAAAVGWMAERGLGWPNPLAPAVDVIAANGWWIVAALGTIAGGARLLERTFTLHLVRDGQRP